MSIRLSKPTSGSGSGASNDEPPRACIASLALRQSAYWNSSTGRLEPASAAVLATAPAIGFVVSKSGATLAALRTDGRMDGMTNDVGAPLVPSAIYYQSATVPGGITAVAPSAPGQIVQKVGSAIDADSLLVNIDSDFLVV